MKSTNHVTTVASLDVEDFRMLIGYIGVTAGLGPKNTPEIADFIHDSLENPEEIVPYSLVCSMICEVEWQKRIKDTSNSH